MTQPTKIKARRDSKALTPIRRSDVVSKTTTEAPDALDEGQTKQLTDEDMDEFEVEAAYDLLGSDAVRSVETNPMSDTAPTVYRLEDVHFAWRAATEDQLPNVAAIRDAWNDTSDEDCCLGCLCDRFLEQTLDYITIDHRAGLIVLQGC